MLKIDSNKPWLRPFKNAGKLLVGRGVQGVLSLGYLAFATRTLGLHDFGILTLIHSTMLLLRNILGFQSWQMVLRYGAKAMAAENAGHLLKLISFAVMIELVAGVLGFSIIEIFMSQFLHLFEIPPHLADMVRIYALMIIVLLLSDVGLGILRLTDRHDLISWQLTVEPIIRFVGAGWLFFHGGELFEFLIVWFVAGIIGRIVLLALAAQNILEHIAELKEKHADVEHPEIGPGVLRSPEVGLWKYVWGTNLDYSLGMGITQLGPILVGAALGPAGAGLYRVAQQFANIIGHPVGKMLLPAIYTDMTWLNATGKSATRRHMVIKTGLLASGLSAVVVMIMALIGEWLIVSISGKEFIEAYSTMVVLAVATVFGALTFGLEPLLMTAGKVRKIIIARAAATAGYVLVMFPLVAWLGLVGAAVAVFVRWLVFVILAGWSARKLLAKKPKEIVA